MEPLTHPGGKNSVTGEMLVRSDGQRYMRVTTPPVSTLKPTHFSLEDVLVIAYMPRFFADSGQSWGPTISNMRARKPWY